MKTAGDSHTRPLDSGPDRLWTLANALTLARLLLAPVIALAIVCDEHVLAGAAFTIAIITDLADGRVARRRGEATAFGGFFDHVTDALFVASGLAALTLQGVVPGWLPVLLLLAFAQYTVDSKVLAGHPLRASRLGRWNGIGYFVVLGTPVVRDTLRLDFPTNEVVLWLAWGLVVTTLVSMVDRALALYRLARTQN